MFCFCYECGYIMFSYNCIIITEKKQGYNLIKKYHSICYEQVKKLKK